MQPEQLYNPAPLVTSSIFLSDSYNPQARVSIIVLTNTNDALAWLVTVVDVPYLIYTCITTLELAIDFIEVISRACTWDCTPKASIR